MNRAFHSTDGASVNFVSEMENRKPAFQKGKSDFSKDLCFCCNKKGHRAGFSDCPAKFKECRTCGKLGHFAIVCKSGKVSQNFSRKPKEVKNVNVFSVSSGAPAASYVSVSVNSVVVTLLVDTSSQLTILPYSLYMQSFSQFPLLPSDFRVTQFDGSTVTMSGKFCARMSFAERSIKADISVTDRRIHNKPILGQA